MGDPPHDIPIGTPEQVGIDPVALAKLEADAGKYETNALLVVKDGLLVYQNYFGGQEMSSIAMSASKSFVNLAVGWLIAEGKLSLTEPGSDFIPAWTKDPLKAQITIQHLLNHTSGLDPDRAFDASGNAIGLEDFLASQPMDATPGQIWLYNNDAVDALALIAERAAGTTLELYLGQHLFFPIGANPGKWMRYPDGAPMGAGELVIDPIDMAKVGMVLANDEQHLLPAGWIDTSLLSTPFEPTCGLLWWKDLKIETWGLPQSVVDYWASHGINADIITAVTPLVGKEYVTYDAAAADLRATITPAQLQTIAAQEQLDPHFPLWNPVTVGPMKAYYANGWMGQYLWVEPTQHLVVIRMHYPTAADYGSAPPSTEFPELLVDALALVGETQ